MHLLDQFHSFILTSKSVQIFLLSASIILCTKLLTILQYEPKAVL